MAESLCRREQELLALIAEGFVASGALP